LRRMLSNPTQPAAHADGGDPWALPNERSAKEPPRDAWETSSPARTAARFACRICGELEREDALVRDERGFRCARCPEQEADSQPIREGKYR
jgi:hypothetical protein